MSVFSHTAAELLPTLDEIRRLEPIFHTEAFGMSQDAFATRMSEDFWEVGASGRRYGREFILANHAKVAVSAVAEGWQSSGHALRALGEGNYLHTYTLNQQGRITRRATIWRNSDAGWQILYHQGTVVLDGIHDELPTK